MLNLPDSLCVLLDECLPRKLRREFTNCIVSTVPEMGWSGKKNGELMKVAHGHFDVFVTADQTCSISRTCLTPMLVLWFSWRSTTELKRLRRSCHRLIKHSKVSRQVRLSKLKPKPTNCDKTRRCTRTPTAASYLIRYTAHFLS